MDDNKKKNKKHESDSEAVSNFNDEVVWDNNRDLFDIYFNAKFRRQKHHIAYLNIDETNFEKSVDILKNNR